MSSCLRCFKWRGDGQQKQHTLMSSSELEIFNLVCTKKHILDDGRSLQWLSSVPHCIVAIFAERLPLPVLLFIVPQPRLDYKVPEDTRPPGATQAPGLHIMWRLVGCNVNNCKTVWEYARLKHNIN